MKKSILIFVFAMVVSVGGLFAKTVTADQARSTAINFFKVTVADGRERGALSATLNYTRTEADNTVDFYVFDIQPGPGFVIVSADDIITPILGYSTDQNFRSDLNQTGVVDWMKHAAQNVYKGIQQNLPATSRISSLWVAYNSAQRPASMKSTVVAPLVFTLWNQEPYYNALCPVNTSVTPHATCVTGCVATTMAQIMRFWSYPPRGTGSYSYDDSQTDGYSNNYGTQSANFAATTYDWASMPISLSSENVGIATLMYQCGVSVGMDYGTDAQNGSGAEVLPTFGGPCAENAYTAYFAYNPNTIQGVYEAQYNATDWLNLIENDLNAGRPVQYVGEDPTAGGHTWVCDGYDGNGLLHMNWGWGGSANGYYAVDNLSAGGYNFSSQEAALIGIEPLVPSGSNASNHISICQGDTTKLTAKITNHASYSWSPTLGLSCPTCALTSANPNATTVYIGRTDSAGVVDTTVIVVSVYPRVTSSPTFSNLNCYGAADGVIALNASGGIPGYSYTWSNGLNLPTSSTLSAGTYVITITDAVGCQNIVTETLTQPAGIDATTSATGTGCATKVGSASVIATGGAGGLTYKWNTGSTDTSLTNLGAGTYTVTVTDSHNCTTVVDAVVAEPYQIQFGTASTSTLYGQFNGAASVQNITGGTAPYSFAWSDGETAETITGLEAGIYTVTVTDHNGCFETATDTVQGFYPTGIAPVSDAFSFSVYPNPTHAVALVQLSKLGVNTTLKLENVLGQTLLTKTVTDTETQLDLSSFSGGVYFIEIQQGEKRQVKQLVLNK